MKNYIKIQFLMDKRVIDTPYLLRAFVVKGILKKQGINFHMQTKVEGITKNTNGASVSTSDKDGKKINFDCDVVLISVGRKPNTNNLNLEAIGVELDESKIPNLKNLFF